MRRSALLKSPKLPTISEQVGTTSFLMSSFSGLRLFWTQGVPYSWFVVLQRLLLAVRVKVLSPEWFCIVLFITQIILENYSLKVQSQPVRAAAVFLHQQIIFKIEQQKMTFLPGNRLQFSPNSKLGSYSKGSSHSDQIIQKLYRENVYLKSQLFSLIQNTPSLDTANPNEMCIYQTNVNTARIFLSPNSQMLSPPQTKRDTIQFFHRRDPDQKYFSPSSSPNSRKTEQFFRMKSKSPRKTLDYYKQCMGQSKIKQSQLIQNNGNFNDLRTIRSYDASPSTVTPQQSCILTPCIKMERSRSPTLNFRKSKEQQVDLCKVKRYKSPSFLKNRKSFKENIQECMQNIALQKEQDRQSFKKSQVLSKDGQLNHLYEQLQKYQLKMENEQKANAGKNQKCFDQSVAGSTISIERRLKEILNHPNSS